MNEFNYPRSHRNLIAEIIATRMTNGSWESIFTHLRLPPQLESLAKNIGGQIPNFTPRFLIVVQDTVAPETIWSQFTVWLLENFVLPIEQDQEIIENVIASYKNGSWLDYYHTNATIHTPAHAAAAHAAAAHITGGAGDASDVVVYAVHAVALHAANIQAAGIDSEAVYATVYAAAYSAIANKFLEIVESS